MPKRVVDILEIVEIKEQQSNPLPPPTSASQSNGHSVAKQGAVRQSCEGIVIGEELDLPFR
jgi:hypothetical protein